MRERKRKLRRGKFIDILMTKEIVKETEKI